MTNCLRIWCKFCNNGQWCQTQFEFDFVSVASLVRLVILLLALIVHESILHFGCVGKANLISERAAHRLPWLPPATIGFGRPRFKPQRFARLAFFRLHLPLPLLLFLCRHSALHHRGVRAQACFCSVHGWIALPLQHLYRFLRVGIFSSPCCLDRFFTLIISSLLQWSLPASADGTKNGVSAGTATIVGFPSLCPKAASGYVMCAIWSCCPHKLRVGREVCPDRQSFLLRGPFQK